MKGKITISGKVYECEVRNGVRYVDGKTVPEFAKTLSPSELMDNHKNYTIKNDYNRRYTTL